MMKSLESHVKDFIFTALQFCNFTSVSLIIWYDSKRLISKEKLAGKWAKSQWSQVNVYIFTIQQYYVHLKNLIWHDPDKVDLKRMAHFISDQTQIIF